MQFVPTLPPEEVARANFYGLLARLFYASPDAELLQALAGADELDAEDDGLAQAWRDLARAAAAVDAQSVEEEYDGVFVGVGKAPVSIYTCAYSIRYANEAPLVDLKADLAELGLARQSGSHEPEDHVAALFDVMRILIAEKKADLASQKLFFEKWIWPTIEPLCSAIRQSDKTDFYKVVAAFTLELCMLEHAAFEML